MTATTPRLHHLSPAPPAPPAPPVEDLRTLADSATPSAAEVLDATRCRALAERWVAEHLPGRTVVDTRSHTAYYRAHGDVSVRVSVDLDAGTPVTLLLRDRGCRATPFPHDPDLPTLAPLLRPEVAEAVLTEHLGVPYPRWCTVSVVHHPRTGACVLRYEFADRTDGVDRAREVYLKVYPTAAEAAGAAARAQAPGSRLLLGPDGTAVRLPRVLALLPARHAIVLESVAPARRLPAVTPRAAGTALAALHRHHAPGALPLVTARDRLAAVAAEADFAAGPWPELSARVGAVLDRLRPILERRPHDAVVLSHGDFTPSQVLRRPDGLAVIDLDTLCLSEPAADLGRFLAYRSLTVAREQRRSVRPLTGPRPHREIGTGEFLAGYGQPLVPDMDLTSRVLAHRSLTLAHVALHAARRFKEERTSLALALLEHPQTPQGADR